MIYIIKATKFPKFSNNLGSGVKTSKQANCVMYKARFLILRKVAGEFLLENVKKMHSFYLGENISCILEGDCGMISLFISKSKIVF